MNFRKTFISNFFEIKVFIFLNNYFLVVNNIKVMNGGIFLWM